MNSHRDDSRNGRDMRWVCGPVAVLRLPARQSAETARRAPSGPRLTFTVNTEYDLRPEVLRGLPDDTPMTVYVDPSVLNLRARKGSSRLAPIATTLGDVRKALVDE